MRNMKLRCPVLRGIWPVMRASALGIGTPSFANAQSKGPIRNDDGPFGGRKMSGSGRQLGSEGLETVRHTKLATIDPTANAPDFRWFPYKDEEAFPGTH